MRQVPVPTIDDEAVFDAFIAAKAAPRNAHLLAARAVVLNAYDDYFNNVPEVANIPVAVLTPEQREALLHAYAVDTRPMSSLRADLTASALVVLCPFCELSEAATLDHYLPKELHPQFAVFSLNLVPCCSRCNLRKTDLVVDEATNVRLFIHPYFDEIIERQFVKLRVSLRPDALRLTFGVQRPVGMNLQIFRRVQSHFKLLRLADRYRKMSLNHLRDRRRALARFYGEARDAQRVAAELIQDALDFEADFGPNHWRAILYRALATDEDFCDGGFRVLNLIQ